MSVMRSFHSKRFIKLGSTRNIYKYSFFNRTVKENNVLPSELVEQKTFKSSQAALLSHLSFLLLIFV